MCKRTDKLTPEQLVEYKKKKAAVDRAYRERKGAELLEKKKEYYAKNKEIFSEKSAKKYQENPDYYKRKSLEWKAKNKARHNFKCMERYTRKLQATPVWIDELMLLVIEEYYDLAQRMGELTGVPHEVDHIVPLKGSNVCGLNVPWNLQLLTQSQNASKKNKLFQELARDLDGWRK